MNERIRDRFQRAAASVLEDGETVELGTLTHTGPMFYDPMLSPLNFINSSRGKTEGRALFLTDRRVLYARTSMTGVVKEVIATWKVGSAPITIERTKRGANVIVDGEVSGLRRGTDGARDLVARAAGSAR
jgi:hypothetical protein